VAEPAAVGVPTNGPPSGGSWGRWVSAGLSASLPLFMVLAAGWADFRRVWLGYTEVLANEVVHTGGVAEPYILAVTALVGVYLGIYRTVQMRWGSREVGTTGSEMTTTQTRLASREVAPGATDLPPAGAPVPPARFG